MKFKIINRYIIKEIFPNYFLGLGFLSVMMLVLEIFRLIQLFVEKNVSLYKVVKMLILYMPLIFQFTIPIAMIIGIILAIGRFSDDNEIIAMRSCGVGLSRIFLSTFIFGLGVSIFTLIFYEFIFPKTTKLYAEAKIDFYQKNPTAELSKKLSFNTINGIKIVVDEVNPKTNELKNVRIYYLEENKMIFAQRAILLAKDYEKNVYPLILFNSILQPSNMKNLKNNQAFHEQFSVKQIIYIPSRFTDAIVPLGYELWSLTKLYKSIQNSELDHSSYVLNNFHKLLAAEIDHNKEKNKLKIFFKKNKAPKKNTKEFKIYNEKLLEKKVKIKKKQIIKRRLNNQIKRRISPEGRIIVESEIYLYHRRLTFAFSAFAFSLLGAPLGIFSKRAGKSLGLGLSILLIVLFFIFIFLGQFLMKKQLMSPIVAAWYTNWIFSTFGLIYVYQRLSGKESWALFLKSKINCLIKTFKFIFLQIKLNKK